MVVYEGESNHKVFIRLRAGVNVFDRDHCMAASVPAAHIIQWSFEQPLGRNADHQYGDQRKSRAASRCQRKITGLHDLLYYRSFRL
jgi:hypothetical protein